LAAAASQGHLEVVQQILDCQTDSTMELSWDQNAFTQAAGNRNHEILRLLIQHKRKFPGRLSANIAPWEALEQAALSGEEATVRLLLDNVQMEMTEDNWHSPWSALSVAAAEKEETIAYLLLQYGADVRATSKYQSTLYVRSLPGEHKSALVHAAANGMTSLLKVLIEKLEETYPGGDGLVAEIDRFGDKPKSFQDFLNEALLQGAANGHADVVELLVLKGADIE
jgi:ankyrin repeat protein